MIHDALRHSHFLSRAVWLVSIFPLAACAADASQDSIEKIGQSEQRAVVSPEDAARAYEVVGKLDYLPFNYKDDGCYARALYMSMEIAAKGIPSSSQFVMGTLRPDARIVWGYHVAPMLQIDGVRTIIDPSMEKTPVTFDTWVSHMARADEVDTFFVPGSQYLPDRSAPHTDPMITGFDQLPKFQTKDVAHACGVLWRYLGLENPQRPRGREKLVSRTRTLVVALHQVDKLDYTSGDQLRCGTETVVAP